MDATVVNYLNVEGLYVTVFDFLEPFHVNSIGVLRMTRSSDLLKINHNIGRGHNLIIIFRHALKPEAYRTLLALMVRRSRTFDCHDRP